MCLRLLLLGSAFDSRCGRSLFSGIPVIQFMGGTVAVAALGEFGKHSCRMRSAVATLTGRYHFVLFFVARYARNGFVLGVTACKLIKGLLMAGCTHLVCGVGSIGNSGRHMCLVATFAIGCAHICTMRLMTLGTGRNLAVNIVAETAGQLGMFAWNLLQFDYLLGMAA